MHKDKAYKWLSYIFYLYPLFLILGSSVNNFFQIVICLFSIYIILKKEVIISKDQRIIFTLVILLFFYSFLVTLYNGNYFFLKNTLIFIKIVFFCIVIDFLISKKIFDLKKFIYTSSVILIIVIFDTFFQFFNGKNLIGFEIEPNNLVRLTSFFKDEYVVGGFIARIYLPILIFFTFLIKNQKNKFWFFLLFSIIINISIFITGERSSIIISILNFCLLFIFVKELRKQIIYKLLFSIFVVAIILTISNPLKDRYIKSTIHDTFKIFAKNENKHTIYDSQYGALFLASLEIAKDNYLFGQGLRTYRIKSCKENFKTNIQNKISKKTNHSEFICSTHPHNYILELMLDLGLIGLIIFIALIYLILKRLIFFKKNKNKSGLEKLCIIAFALHFLSIFWPINTHGSIFSSWNSTFYLFNLSLFISLSANNSINILTNVNFKK